MCHLNFARRDLLLLLHEAAGQDQKLRTIKESQQPIAVAPNLHTNFPEIFCANKFLQVLLWDNLKPLYQSKHPRDFLGMPI
jgi:hypothetical protein